MNVVMIAVFGTAGVLARYAIDRWLVDSAGSFPLATFLINISGSFLIGAIYAYGAEKNLLSEPVRLALTIGFLGGFTTFSAYSLQIIELAEGRLWAMAAAYLFLSPALGVLAAWLGLTVVRNTV